ncbi:MAG: TIM barrel protein [Acidimicrobiia bacterium]|nr:TIM barrel protein [Acidimicrobiia bacterium]
MTEPGIVVANAPISYGAFELTVGIDPAVPAADALLDHIVDAGYTGIDLGPIGFLGEGDLLRSRLQSRGLGLAGGYLELPFSDHDALTEQIPELDALLDVFDAAPDTHPAPKPTLADAGSAIRRANPGKAATDRSFGFDDAAWGRFAVGLQRTVDHCRGRGYEPTLHPEAGTHIEAAWEIDQALERTDIGFCLETGHQLVGGGDALPTIEKWGARINHVHLKDASRNVIAEIIADHGSVEEIWRRRAFPPLGGGDVPVDDVVDGLVRLGYTGWLVVEQDIMPGSSDPAQAHAHQVANRELLRAHGL